VLREGLARNPRAAMLHHALGLALVRQKQKTDSLAELRAAAELAPESGRFAYVYAMGLDDAGRTSDALKVLAAAHARHPYDRDVLSARAFLTVKAGDRATALHYANRLRELDPENAEYARMAQQIEGGLPR